jgi:hypothetical protein
MFAWGMTVSFTVSAKVSLAPHGAVPPRPGLAPVLTIAARQLEKLPKLLPFVWGAPAMRDSSSCSKAAQPRQRRRGTGNPLRIVKPRFSERAMLPLS